MGKYSDAIRQSQRDIEQQRARSAGLTGPAVSPDDMGRAIAKADRLGQPPAVVADNLSQYDELDHLDQISRVSETPALARWLGDPNQSTLAKDDLGTLSGIAGFMTRGFLATSPVVTGMAIPRTVLEQQAREREQADEAAKGPQMRGVEPSWFSELIGDFQSGWFRGKQSQAITLPDFSSPRTRSIEEVVARDLGYRDRAEFIGGQTAQAVAQFGRQAEGASRTTRATEAALARLQAANETGSTGNIVRAALQPRVVMSVVAQSLGATAPNLAISASLPASRLMQATTTGGSSGMAEYGFTVLDVMAEEGVNTSDAADVSRFLRDREAMDRARSKAAKRGVVIGVFDALTAGFAGRLLANSRRGLVSPVARVAGEGVVQAGGGAAGEAGAQLATEGRIENLGDVVLEAAAEVPTFLAEGRGQISEARRNARMNADRFDAAKEQSALTRLVTLSSESKTRARSASRFESLVRSMTAEGEDTVYIPAEAARTLFQSGTDEGARGPLEGMVSAAELNEAIATGGEVAVPLAQYVTFMSPEQHAAIADQVRLQPGARHDVPAVSPEEIQQAIADGLAEAQSQEERENGPAGQVFDEVYGQLLSRQDEKLARQNASVVQSVYRNLAERAGTDAWTLFNQFRINIPGVRRDARGAPRGIDTDVDPLLDALRSGKLPTDADIVGEGLASALVRAGGLRADEGGELANLEAGRRPGLIAGQGMSLDDALVWAYQEGFIDQAPTQFRETFDADAPDIQTLLDLLGRDLAGDRVGRTADFNVRRAQFREDASRLQEELDVRGIDLGQMDNRRARELLGMTRQTQATTAENDEREAQGLPRLYQSAVPEATELEQLRARVAELERELRTDRLTGLRNQRAFDEDASLGWPVVSAADMDGLKRLNDSVGHEAADEVLRVLGGIMLAEEGAGVRFYRRSGDEFAARFEDPAAADRVMADLQARLEEVAIDFDVIGSDGETRPLTYDGIGISYGNGQDYAAADAAANRNKAERLEAGVREEARAHGEPRRLRPRRDSRWGEGRRAEDQGQARPGDVGDDSTLNQSARRSPELREFLGGSKVRGVVYHATRGDFDEFDTTRSDLGAHFGSAEQANHIAERRLAGDRPGQTTGVSVVPVHLRIKSPLRLKDEGSFHAWSIAKQLARKGIVDKKTADRWESEGWRENGKNNAEAREAIKEAGYDGIVYKNTQERNEDNWIAFDPGQIKSATANRGTFDPSDPNILMQPAFHGTPHDVDRFSLQKIGTGEGAQAFGWGLYFASKREVAEGYREALAGSNPADYVVDGKVVFTGTPKAGDARQMAVYFKANDGRDWARKAREFGDMGASDDFVRQFEDESRKLERKRVERREVKKGNIYQVEVPEDSDLLDYDKPLSEQPEKVREALAAMDPDSYSPDGDDFDANETGGQIYNRLLNDARDYAITKGDNAATTMQASAAKASRDLLAFGIPGLRYLDGLSRGKGGTHNYVIWDENALGDPQRLLDQSARGSVTFRTTDDGRQFDINLLAGMDASTFMHEMGHVYLELVTDLAAREGAPQQIVDDVATINEWLGRTGGTTTVEQHEQFARGFEAYLREGKAPTSALRRVFAAFKVWLTAIYRSAVALDVELTDEVRGVFDRILASDAEIAEARGEQYQEALITDALAVGMSAEEFVRYNAAVAGARADAEAVVAAELLRAMQIENRAWYRAERKNVQAEVTQQLRESPAYRAQRLLRTGKLPDGSEAPQELQIKLDKDDLLDHYGQDFLRNLRGMYAVEGGVPSDEAAAILGYRSGAELVDMLVNAPPLNEAIASETDERMRTRHPDPMTDGTLPDRAMVAAHRDRQAAVMVREIRALEGMGGGRPRTEAAVIKGIAAQIIAGKKLRSLQPASYRAAEAKAGREAFEAAANQDWPAAAAARRRQLLNFELFREAVRARNEATATARYLAKFGQTKTRARLGKARGDYLEQIDALLDRFDFRKITDKASDRRASLAAWIKLQSERGQELDLPDAILDEAFRLPYRELTMAQLRDVRDAVRAIDHLAKLKGKLLLGNETRDAAQIDAEMAESVREATAEAPVTTGDPTNSQKVLKAFRQGRAFLQATATDLARELDGFKPGGAVWRNTVGVIRDAMNNVVNPELRKAQEGLAGIYLKHYTKDEVRDFGRKIPMPEVNGDLWSKRRLLALALNWGNEGNREAILSQSKARMTKGQVDALLGRLDARDWAFVQDVWALIDGYWPAIQEAQKRRTGLAPEKVQASPFVVRTADGQTLSIPGGYYPLKYEADSIRTMKDEADDFYDSIRTGRSAKAATRRGHTIERVGSGGRTVALDTSLIQSHLRDVIRDLYLGDAVNYVHDVLNGSGFREAIDATGQQEYARALEVWLRDVASGEIGPRVWHERAMRAVRTNFTASVLAFKPVSAALQITGLLQSAVVLGHADVWQGAAQYATKPVAMTNYVREVSPFMASRMQTHVEAVQQVMDAEAGRWKSGQAAMIRMGYWMMGRVQQVVDTISWLAAENKGMRLFDSDVDKARAYADDVVSRAQSSGEFIDKTPVQRGTLGDNVRQSEWIKATTVLASYMLAKGNAAYEITRKTNFRSPLQATRWAMNMALLFAVEAVLVAAIRGKLPDDEDDDGTSDEWAAFLAGETLSSLFGALPGGGTAVSEMRGYDAKGVMATAWESVYKLRNEVEQAEMDKGVIKAAITVAGVTFGLPSAQINKTIDAVTASANGEDVSPYEYLTGPDRNK